MSDNEPSIKKRKLSVEEEENVESNNCDFTSSEIPLRSRNELQELIEIFSREQLTEILISSALQYDSVFEEIVEVASADLSHRKIFVRGLAWDTTSESLRQSFEIYGTVEEAAVIKDKNSEKSKGFGFVTFQDMYAARKALKEPKKKIDGRETTCNLAALKSSGFREATHGNSYQQPFSNSVSGPGDISRRKVFVRGLSWETTDNGFRVFFQQFGNLEEASVARDKKTGKSKGFGFITYCDINGANAALQNPQKNLDGRRISCNLAVLGNPTHHHSEIANSSNMPQTIVSTMPTMIGGMPAYVVPPDSSQIPVYASSGYSAPTPSKTGRLNHNQQQQQVQQQYGYSTSQQYPAASEYATQQQYLQIQSYGQPSSYSQCQYPNQTYQQQSRR